MRKALLNLDGLRCGGCVTRVADALRRLPGVSVERVDLRSALVSHDPARTPADVLVRAVNGLGYSASPQAQEAGPCH